MSSVEPLNFIGLSEKTFNIVDLQNVEDLTTKTKVNEIVAHMSKSKDNVAGRVTLHRYQQANFVKRNKNESR